jgi:hypothetical protein
MPLLSEDTKLLPRVSTPDPVNVPNAPVDYPDPYDFGTFLDGTPAELPGKPTLQTFYQQPVSFQSGLKLNKLSLTDNQDSLDAKKQYDLAMDSWSKENAFYGLDRQMAGGQSGAASGGRGAAAYGIKGVTGLAQYKGSAPYGLQPKMYSALTAAMKAMQAAGLGGFGITDGFRALGSPGDGAKRNPYSQYGTKARKGGLAATPGTSIHGTGYAADLDLTKAQAEWLRKNGARFGIYAPIYKKERWHWEYLPNLV